MSRRRLERGYWNGRKVRPTEKEHNLIYVFRPDRGRYYHRFSMTISMDWPWPNSFTLDHRLPRKTKKALWKQLNGDFQLGLPSAGNQYPVVIHNGRKP